MVVEALYHDGLLKPAMPIDLTDGEWVELEVTRRLPPKPANVVSLKGIWRQHIQSTDEGDWASDTIAEIRRETNLKLDRLAAELAESMASENASRLASMQAAERNIGERPEDLNTEYHQLRQTAITAELLDIVSGFEALAESQ